MYTKQRERNIIVSIVPASEMSTEEYREIEQAENFGIMLNMEMQELYVFMEIFNR